jgi:Holliday junction resolvase RusA-like endonuclease
MITSHAKKAALLLEEYKNRLGLSTQTQMHFNLLDLVPTQDLQHLEEPFTKEEIDNIIKTMPTDKAPGPDGFNGTFLKNVGI